MTEEQLAELSDEELEKLYHQEKMKELGDDSESQSDSNEDLDQFSLTGNQDEPEQSNVDEATNEDVDYSDNSEEEPEQSIDEVEEGEEETSNEPEGQPDEEPTGSEDDTESKPSETLELRPVKIDGQEVPINSLDELYTLASAGGKFTKKMQALSKYQKAYMIMDKQGLTEQDISLLAEAKAGNKDAIATLIKEAGIDPLDLDDEPNEHYIPGAFIPSDTAVALEEVQKEISADPEYTITSNIVNNVLDERSQERMIENPNLIRGIHEDIKSGAFQYVMAEAEKLKLMDGARRPDLEYYIMAAQRTAEPAVMPNANTPYSGSMQNQQASQQMTQKPAVSKSKRKAAGSSRSKVPPKTGPINWDELSDEELMAKREEILSRY